MGCISSEAEKTGPCRPNRSPVRDIVHQLSAERRQHVYEVIGFLLLPNCFHSSHAYRPDDPCRPKVHFVHFLIILPVLGKKEKTLPVPSSIMEPVLGGSPNPNTIKKKELYS